MNIIVNIIYRDNYEEQKQKESTLIHQLSNILNNMISSRSKTKRLTFPRLIR